MYYFKGWERLSHSASLLRVQTSVQKFDSILLTPIKKNTSLEFCMLGTQTTLLFVANF